MVRIAPINLTEPEEGAILDEDHTSVLDERRQPSVQSLSSPIPVFKTGLASLYKGDRDQLSTFLAANSPEALRSRPTLRAGMP